MKLFSRHMSPAPGRGGMLLISALLALLPLPGQTHNPVMMMAIAAGEVPYTQREDVKAYVDELVAEHGFQREALTSLITQVRYRQDIIDRITRPAEKVWTWGRYKKILVGPERIAQGVAFWRAHEATLNRAAQTYGVAPEYIVAILGIETRYGQHKGDFPVLDALFTLGFDYPPRAKFFRSELTHFLLLAREEQKAPDTLLGSYAGAMGYGQFIPSSYRHYAVDFDNDGVRDIWQNPVDAIGSIGNYFAQHRWRQAEQAVALQVDVSRVKDLPEWTNKGLKLQHRVAELTSAGVVFPEGVVLDNDAKANLYAMETEAGIEYWVALHNFYVITRYNRSQLYALAVWHIADGLKTQFARDNNMSQVQQ